ncbi:PREDICTED: claudin domain-containing protein 2 [Nanorana parkeri]|uniref:claudin domain-containing protein 2 n=1 Tax=Nanorana parkeri TaxID=125878 RepID=UPI000854C2A7|nr:PREDICTED: claudin domain-containing protein 2 [Nanorana parkeri]
MLWGNVGGLISSSLSFILGLTGILSDYWLVNFGSGLYHEGIWQRCTNNVCTKITGRGYINATSSLLILSTALLLFGMVFSCLTFFNYHVGRFTASLAAGTLEVLSAMFLIIGMVVYTSETAHDVLNSSFNFEWSFFLCWTAGLLTIVAATSHILAHQATPRAEYESM